MNDRPEAHPSDLALQGRHVLVTGAGRGLGRAMAIGAAAAGALVTVVARSADQLDTTAAEIARAGGHCRVHPADLTHTGAIDAVVDAACGQQVVDGVVHAAGVQRRRPATEVQAEDWQHVVGTNLQVPYFLSTALARRQLAAAIPASHVFIGSLASRIAIPNASPYAASKSALMGVVRTLANEWAPSGIRVNILHPGYYHTELTADLLADPAQHDRIIGRIPMRRLGLAEDLIGPAVFLLSDSSAYVTGTSLVVDGGWLSS